MKNGILKIVGLACLSTTVMLSSCAPEKQEAEPISSADDYSKVIMYSVDQNSSYFDDIDDEDFTPFGAMGEEIIQDVLSGKLKAFHPFDPEVEMTMEDVKAQLFVSDTFYTTDTLTFDLMMNIVEHDYTKDIQSLKFKERWNYGSGTGVIDKRLVAVAPRKAVIDYESKTIRGYAPLFWVKFE
jgi:hypothetical protein